MRAKSGTVKRWKGHTKWKKRNYNEWKRTWPNDAMSQWSAAASKRLDCRTWKRAQPQQKWKILPLSDFPRQAVWRKKCWVAEGPPPHLDWLHPTRPAMERPTMAGSPSNPRKEALSAKKKYAGTNARSQPRSWVSASIKTYLDFIVAEQQMMKIFARTVESSSHMLCSFSKNETLKTQKTQKKWSASSEGL